MIVETVHDAGEKIMCVETRSQATWFTAREKSQMVKIVDYLAVHNKKMIEAGWDPGGWMGVGRPAGCRRCVGAGM